MKRFIPVADDVERLQTGKDEECLFFQKVADQGHYAGRTTPSATRQGTYAATADGTLLLSWNTNDPRVVASKLQQAISKWDRLHTRNDQPSKQNPLDATKLNRVDRFYPKDGLVLRVVTRDLPRDPPQEERWKTAWNRDFAWFTKDEARQWLPPSLEQDETCAVPPALVQRLVRLHFLDNVRGQTTPFSAEAVQTASITSQITAINGDVVEFRLDGHTKAEEEGRSSIAGYTDAGRLSAQKRGVELRLLARGSYNRKHGKFISFELVAVGTRWGGTKNNVRMKDLDPAQFGVLLTLADDSRAERVAPEHFEGYGWN